MAYEEESVIINYISKFVDEVRIVELKQLELIVMKAFSDNTRGDFYNAITAMRETKKIIISEDEWVLDYYYYQEVTKDYYLDNIDEYGKANFKKNIADYLGKDILRQSDCMWIMASLMPDSRDFVINTFPWYVSFCMKKKATNTSIYVRVTELDDSLADAQIKLLKDYMRTESEKFSENTVSNVMIHNIDIASFIPIGMFRNVCVMDSESRFGFRVLKENEIGTYLDASERYYEK